MSLLLMKCSRQLFRLLAEPPCLIQDFGNTWTNLTENSDGRIASFVDFDWGVLLQPWSKYREQPADKTIFATAYEDPKHMKAGLNAGKLQMQCFYALFSANIIQYQVC